MRDYIKNSKQVDMFLGSIDPVIIEFQFSNHPKVIFKKALETFTNLAEKFVYEAIPKSKAVVGRKQFDPLFMMQVIIVARRFGLTDKEMAIQLKTDILMQYLLGFKAIDYKALPGSSTVDSPLKSPPGVDTPYFLRVKFIYFSCSSVRNMV